MSRSMMFGAVAFAALMGSMATAVAQDEVVNDNGITITGPRARLGDESGSIMQMSRLTAATHVYYADLDLRTLAGRNALKNRVWYAARNLCNRLEDLNASNIPLTRDEPCTRQAVFYAQQQVAEAVALHGR